MLKEKFNLFLPRKCNSRYRINQRFIFYNFLVNKNHPWRRRTNMSVRTGKLGKLERKIGNFPDPTKLSKRSWNSLKFPSWPLTEWAHPASWRWTVEGRRTSDWHPGRTSSPPPSPPSTWTSAGPSTSSPPPPSLSTMGPWTREASW